MKHKGNKCKMLLVFAVISLLLPLYAAGLGVAEEAGDFSEGGSAAESAEELDDEEPDVDLFIGMALYQRYFGYDDEALGQLEMVAKVFPKSIEAHLYTGIIHELNGRYEKALKAYEQVMNQAPESLIGYVFAGNLVLKAAEEAEEGDIFFLLDMAEWFFGKAVAIDDQSIMVRDGLERCVSLKKEKE